MTNEQQNQQAWQQYVNEEMKKRQRQQQELQQTLIQAQNNATLRQRWIDEEPRQQYAIIAAVDQQGGFSKEGQIPWHYPEDFKWFKQHTTNQVCVMGRTTYEDINQRLGDKAKVSVLPNRKCFVVSSTLKQEDIQNATIIKSPLDVSMLLTEEDHAKTIFFIGGDKIFQAGMSIADTIYLTAINKTFNCDRWFPTNTLTKLFTKNQMFKKEGEADLRFLVYKRNKKH